MSQQDREGLMNKKTERDYPYRTVAIIQARMGSSRLPGKVLLDIAGKPMLEHVVERTQRAKTINQIVIATTMEKEEDPIANLCQEKGYACYRGNTFDLLDRYYQAAKLYETEIIVRITADCPLIDPQVIDQTMYAFLGLDENNTKNITELITDQSRCPNKKYPYDFAANRLPPPWGRTYPIGLDTEICTFQALETAWQEAYAPHQREHVMPFFYENPERFRILLVNHKEDYGSLRWTVDTKQDLELVRQIYAYFNNQNDFSWLNALDLLRHEPDLKKINAQISHKDYRQIDDRQNH
jgi:spore coat polysaccharide biosynthesis protein SpsF